MKFLHTDTDIFRETLNLTTYRTSFLSQTAEMDYFTTMFVSRLLAHCQFLALTGGAALEKCYKLINRSLFKVKLETFGRMPDNADELIVNSIGRAADELGLSITSLKSISERHIQGQLEYKSAACTLKRKESFEVDVELADNIAHAGVSKMPVECKMLETLKLAAPQHIAYEYGAAEDINVRDMDVIFAEKVFDICDNYLNNKIRRNSADIYDAYMLLPVIGTEDLFEWAVTAVRQERQKSKEHPSTAFGVDVAELLYKIVNEEIYKQDYNDLTLRLLDAPVGYDDAAATLYTVADSSVFTAV